MKHHDLQQGSPEWHTHRLQHFNASDAPAMLGCSPYQTRTQLLHAMHTGLRAEVDAATQRRFDDGHRFEALARPLGEEIIGEDLYPVVGSEGRLSASFDGLTMGEDIVFEHKSLNDDLRACMPNTGTADNEGSDLPKHYRVQLEQQLHVSGAARALFMASRWDGERVSEVRSCWYSPDAELRAEILRGWAQFEVDLAAYVPPAIKEMPKAEVTLALPALVIHAKGEITTSNMKEYGVALAKRLAEVRAIALITDQDFSNARESAKLLRENIQQAKLAKDAMLAQTVTVGEAARMIDTWCEDMRLTALKLEQDVEREDKAKKTAMVLNAKGEYERHIEFLKMDTGGPWIPLVAPNFAEAIKGKRNFASMQDALDTMLANAKIAADESTRKIRAALAALADESKGYEHLFADRLSFISKPADDVRALVKGRIAEHRAAEERRAAELAEKERARIRQEEEGRARAQAQREQQEAREAQERQQREEMQRHAEEVTRNAQAIVSQAAPPVVSHPLQATSVAHQIQSTVTDNVHPMPTRAPAAPSGPPTLSLGEIKKLVHPFDIGEAGLRELGFEPAARAGAARMYHHADLPRMLQAGIDRLTRVRADALKVAAVA